jgi:hypothetical protein
MQKHAAALGDTSECVVTSFECKQTARHADVACWQLLGNMLSTKDIEQLTVTESRQSVHKHMQTCQASAARNHCKEYDMAPGHVACHVD